MTTNEDDVGISRALQQIGFTDYEARAYAALVAGGELNGYALAKASGIPRANIYAVAGKLVRRGAAQRVERAGGDAYVAVEPKRLLRAIDDERRQAMAGARDALSRLSRERHPPTVLNLRDDEVLQRAAQLIDASAASLHVALQPTEAAQLAEPLRAARERGVAITTLCLEGCEAECGGCAGTIHRCRLAPAGATRWLLVVADERTTLLGHFTSRHVTAVCTEQPLLVELAMAYIQQSTTLAILGSELAGRLEGLLSPKSRRMLDGLVPAGDFLAHMRELRVATP
ncbi:TrmB family transcriptional regulator [Rhodanobacter lindaniclasticus]